MAQIKMKFNAKENIITFEAINTTQDREAMHEAFRTALRNAKFDLYAETDQGEHENAPPIRKDKERLIDEHTQRVLE